MIDADTINAAYALTAKATHALAEATVLETRIRVEIEFRKAYLLTSGEIDGKNAEARDAQLRDRMSTEHETLADVQATVAESRTNLTLAQLEVDRCKTLLRLLETRL